ncbi:MAG: TraR/DksA family transcriptional regulator [Treponemataceae bacterium]
MDKKNIEKLKAQLIEERDKILQYLAQKTEDFSEITSPDKNLTDYADIASSFTDQQMLEAVGVQDMNRLKQINSALLRIQEGKYGKCIKCKKNIPAQRLKAIPYALKCVKCQEADEKKK